MGDGRFGSLLICAPIKVPQFFAQRWVNDVGMASDEHWGGFFLDVVIRRIWDSKPRPSKVYDICSTVFVMSKAVSRAAWVMTALAFVASGLHILGLNGDFNDLIYQIAAAQVFVAVVIGAAVNKPDRRVWLMLTLLIACLIVAQIFDNRDSGSTSAQVVSESLF